jgi:hypothetical protein
MAVIEFFKNHPDSRKLFDALNQAIKSIGPTNLRVSKSQVAFVRKKIFARVWVPERYLRRKAAPLVLDAWFPPPRHLSPRWKEIVEPAPGRFAHHLELYAASDIDAEVKDWLRAAWEAAA